MRQGCLGLFYVFFTVVNFGYPVLAKHFLLTLGERWQTLLQSFFVGPSANSALPAIDFSDHSHKKNKH